MVFEYSDYHFHTFVFPLFICVFFSIFFLITCYHLCKNYKTNRDPIDTFVKLIVVILICGIQIPLHAKVLIDGGIYMYSETAENAIMTVGKIDSISERREATIKIDYNGNNEFGTYVIIDSEQYFMVTCEGFEVGDYVEIEYLPKSKFVLSIYEAEPPTVESEVSD